MKTSGPLPSQWLWMCWDDSPEAIPVRNAGEAADLVRVLVDIGRLESGDPTSQSIVAHVGTAELAALRDEARKAVALPSPSPVALAAAEGDTP